MLTEKNLSGIGRIDLIRIILQLYETDQNARKLLYSENSKSCSMIINSEMANCGKCTSCQLEDSLSNTEVLLHDLNLDT